MKTSPYIAVLDACVLVPMPVVDTLLRLAEEPAFYSPRWSPTILEEVGRTLVKRFGHSPRQVKRRLDTMQAMFPEAMVTGYDDLIAAMTNDPKDRHVLAAAVKCGAHAIVSDNVKHFPVAALATYGVECLTASNFLEHQYHLDPDGFISVLTQQAADIGWTLSQLISKHVPSLSKLIIGS
jgi:predicted nucleic acid-binding protein